MKKILSIDGGGIRGIIPATILAHIEQKTGKHTTEMFDLIAGTSTGGIIALALSQQENGKPKYSAADIVQLYESRAKDIFSRSLWKRFTSVGSLADEKYSHDGLEKVLDDYLGSSLLGSSLTNTLITSYSINARRPIFFKSWRSEYTSILTKDIARATSAAPTYFEPKEITIESVKMALIDGGVFINSPSVSAFAEGKRLFGDEDLFVLSLGTGELTRSIPFNEAKDWGKAEWLLPLFSCMFDGVSDAADYQMRTLLGEHYQRLQIDLNFASDDMDEVSEGNIMNLKLQAKELLTKSAQQIDTICSML